MRVLHDPAQIIRSPVENLGLTPEDRFALTMRNLNFRAALRGEPEIPVNVETPNLPFKPSDRVFAPEKYSFPEGEVSLTDREKFPERMKAYRAGMGR